MSIPRISKDHVLAAIDRIARDGVPKGRNATRYALVYQGALYPPKLVISWAVEAYRGTPLHPSEFGGGIETNRVLRSLGFSVVSTDPSATDLGASGGSRLTRLRNDDPAVQSPEIARVVVRGRPGNPGEAKKMLLDVLSRQWPAGIRVRFLVTPGGFVSGPFPRSWHSSSGWRSAADALNRLAECGNEIVSKVLTSEVRSALVDRVDVLTLGVDLVRDKEHPYHAELVALYEVRSQQVTWTGKSYPTPDQERNLVQVMDLSTHFCRLAGERVLVLGCHDLNMFSPRGRANRKRGGPRYKRCVEMLELARAFAPTVVLHHPHSTDTPNIWRTSWSSLRATLPSVRLWTSGIAYYNSDPRGPKQEHKPRSPLNKVLIGTKSVGCLDFVVDAP